MALPRLHRRGPIEARGQWRRGRSLGGSLPRLHRRGPIEAGTITTVSPTSLLLFHGFIAVAPLKRLLRGTSCATVSTLPRLHRRGPIEAGFVSRLRRDTFGPLPRLHRRGPIEALLTPGD